MGNWVIRTILHFIVPMLSTGSTGTLTVESGSGLKPAYYFTFVPGASPMPSQLTPANVSGKRRPYSSDENALLVQLKENERLSWSEIAEHFPDRNALSLQVHYVHYSSRLRPKAISRSGKPRDSSAMPDSMVETCDARDEQEWEVV